MRNPREAPRLFGFALGLATLAPIWVLLMRGTGGVLGVYCDAFSWPYLVGASAAGLLVALAAQAPVMQGKLLYRLAALGVAGLVGGALFALAAPQCLAGPFAGLDPLVREYWYEQVREGHPLWTQSIGTAALFGVPALAGLLAIVWNLRQAATQPWAVQWQRLALVCTASFILSLFVLRTAMVTHAFLGSGVRASLSDLSALGARPHVGIGAHPCQRGNRAVSAGIAGGPGQPGRGNGLARP